VSSDPKREAGVGRWVDEIHAFQELETPGATGATSLEYRGCVKARPDDDRDTKVFAEAFLAPPSHWRSSEYFIPAIDVYGQVYGGVADFPVLPYSQPCDTRGGRCAQACLYMATMMMMKYGATPLGPFEATLLADERLARGGAHSGLIEIQGLSPSQMVDVLQNERVGLSAHLDVVPYSQARGVSPADREFDLGRKFLRQRVLPILSSGFPVILCVRAYDLHPNEKELHKKTNGSEGKHAILVFGFRRHSTPTADGMAGTTERADGIALLTMDSAVRPFVEVGLDHLARSLLWSGKDEPLDDVRRSARSGGGIKDGRAAHAIAVLPPGVSVRLKALLEALARRGRSRPAGISLVCRADLGRVLGGWLSEQVGIPLPQSSLKELDSGFSALEERLPRFLWCCALAGRQRLLFDASDGEGQACLVARAELEDGRSESAGFAASLLFSIESPQQATGCNRRRPPSLRVVYAQERFECNVLNGRAARKRRMSEGSKAETKPVSRELEVDEDREIAVITSYRIGDRQNEASFRSILGELGECRVSAVDFFCFPPGTARPSSASELVRDLREALAAVGRETGTAVEARAMTTDFPALAFYEGDQAEKLRSEALCGLRIVAQAARELGIGCVQFRLGHRVWPNPGSKDARETGARVVRCNRDRSMFRRILADGLAVLLKEIPDCAWAAEIEPGIDMLLRGKPQIKCFAEECDRLSKEKPGLAVASRVGLNLDIGHAILCGLEPSDFFWHKRSYKNPTDFDVKDLMLPILHAHLSDHCRTHFADATPGTFHTRNVFADWLTFFFSLKGAYAQMAESTPKAGDWLQYFTNTISLELEASQSLRVVGSAYSKTRKIVSEITKERQRQWGRITCVALVFVDLRQSRKHTARIEEGGLEKVAKFYDELLGMIRTWSDRCGGRFDKYRGDGAFVTFEGTDTSDVLSKAYDAAHDIALTVEEWGKKGETLEKYGLQRGARAKTVGVGVGIGHGEVWRGWVGSGRLGDDTVLGLRVIDASRLADAADRHEVLATTEYYKALGNAGRKQLQKLFRRINKETKEGRTPCYVLTE